MASPVQEYKVVVDDSGNPRYVNRLIIGTATTGLVRMEWVAARYGQSVPTNWSQVGMNQFYWPMTYIPLRYPVAEAQNLIVKEAIRGDFEWLLLYEHDVIPPADTFVRFNEYIRKAEIPVVSGLYFTRSIPSEPLVYRGRGVSFYDKWKLGDKVWCDGVPTGMLLIHVSILREMWQDAEEYSTGKSTTRRVFDAPRRMWFNPEAKEFYSLAGTSDLNWCKRVIEGDYLRRAGWGDFVDSLEDPRWPFLVDTQILCRHINPDGQQFPHDDEMRQWEIPEVTVGSLAE